MTSELLEVRAIVDRVEGWLTHREGELLYRLAKRCGGRGAIVEIGSWQGKSTIWLARGSKAGRGVTVHAVDPHIGSPEHREEMGKVWTFDAFRKNVEAAGVADLVTPWVKPSAEAAREFREPVELVFIDGDHDYAMVKQDFESWFPRLVDGGVMAFHDSYRWEGPRQLVWESLYRSTRFREIGFVDSITFGTKVPRNGFRDRVRNGCVYALRTAPRLRRKVFLPRGLRSGGD